MRLKVKRDGKELTLPITVGELKEKEVAATGEEGDLGLAVQPVTPDIAQSLGLDRASVEGKDAGHIDGEGGLPRQRRR